MKRIFWILALVVLFFAGDRISGWVLKQLTMSSQFRYSRMYKGEAKSDILLVGNSRGLIFYQPYIEEITGKSTFNISYNGMPMDLGRVLVEDYLDKYPAPEQMIVDVTMCDRKNSQLVTGFNLYAPYSEKLFELIKKDDQSSAYAGKLSHLYLHNSEIFQRALYHLKKSDEAWLLDREITDFLVKDVVNMEPYTIDLQDELLSELNETIQYAQSKGVKVQLVINPYFPAFAKRITNLKNFRTRIENATGLKVHNYATAIKEVKGFGDYQHLNKKGSRLYLDRLKKDGLLY